MSDYFQVDFLAVETKKSGDAIAIRYRKADTTYIHVVDGGFADTGEQLVAHINNYYESPRFIDHVVLTHPDGDHANGLKAVLSAFEVGTLWMLRPWTYAAELLPRFERYTSADSLAKKLKEVYPYVAALEEIATQRRIPILEPFQGQMIGAFDVLAPSRSRYLDLIVESEKTPEAVEDANDRGFMTLLDAAANKIAAFIRALWGDEVFSPNETSAENEMSVVQHLFLDSKRVLLTGDTGRTGLAEAADWAEVIGIPLRSIDRFQVPHHGSRRNVSTEVLDRWLGERLAEPPPKGEEKFSAFVSSAKADEHHPRKAVVRAMIHRGAQVVTTEGISICTSSPNAPKREGWKAVTPEPYPEEQEE